MLDPDSEAYRIRTQPMRVRLVADGKKRGLSCLDILEEIDAGVLFAIGDAGHCAFDAEAVAAWWRHAVVAVYGKRAVAFALIHQAEQAEATARDGRGK